LSSNLLALKNIVSTVQTGLITEVANLDTNSDCSWL